MKKRIHSESEMVKAVKELESGVSKESGMTMLSRFVHSEKALPPIDFTVSGMKTCLRSAR